MVPKKASAHSGLPSAGLALAEKTIANFICRLCSCFALPSLAATGLISLDIGQPDDLCGKPAFLCHCLKCCGRIFNIQAPTWHTNVGNQMRLAFLVAELLVLVALSGAITAQAASVSLAEKLEIMRRTYPTVIAEIRNDAIVLTSGERLPVDDGEEKDHQAKLKHADIEDALSQIYPLGTCDRGTPVKNFDPGRIRNETLMRILYGRTVSEVKSNLTPVKWFSTRVKVTRRHGVDTALNRVKMDLQKLPRRFWKFYKKSGGTFNWRSIAGTKRLSVHSFGAAIDINTQFTDYWRWSGGKPGNVPKYKNKIPNEIVSIFERHGFIWGGKWYHFDTMHFEYRPELIEIGKLAESRGCAYQ